MSYNFKCLKDQQYLIDQLHPTLNKDIDINSIRTTSQTKLWWQCPKNKDHIWQASPRTRYYHKHGCPYCTGRKVNHTNSLAIKNPNLSKEWHKTKNKNLTPHDVTQHSKKKVWWQCNHGHEWEAEIDSRNTRGCPYCSGRLCDLLNSVYHLCPNLMLEWDYSKNKLDPKTVSKGSQKKIFWKCKNGHSWSATVANRTYNKSNCPICRVNSKAEKIINDILIKLNISFARQKTFAQCKYKKVLQFDFCITLNNKIYLIEYHGQQHYEKTRRKDAKNHFEQMQIRDKIKKEFCQQNDIPLLIIPYTQYKNLESIIINFIKQIYQ